VISTQSASTGETIRAEYDESGPVSSLAETFQPVHTQDADANAEAVLKRLSDEIPRPSIFEMEEEVVF
jgi:hypothetical protein